MTVNLDILTMVAFTVIGHAPDRAKRPVPAQPRFVANQPMARQRVWRCARR
jgi:hypothetical protein